MGHPLSVSPKVPSALKKPVWLLIHMRIQPLPLSEQPGEELQPLWFGIDDGIVVLRRVTKQTDGSIGQANPLPLSLKSFLRMRQPN
jgi:hypothetical protein